MASARRPIDQQVIVITGASSGIGLATAEVAANRGARVAIVARSEQTLQRVAERVGAAGGHALPVTADVADRRQLEHAADVVVEQFGRIDTWVNNAGVSIYGRLEEVLEEDNRRLFDTNFWGVVNGSLVALPHLRETGGVLINVGSEVSDAVIPLQGMYSASKHAVKGFNDALRIELEVEGADVGVVLIQPTAVNTPFPENARNYMSNEPKLPDPQIDPQRVADAILEAAVRPQRYVKVGFMATLNTTMAKFAPAIADRVSAKQSERQHKDKPPVDPAGALFRPCEKDRVYGLGE